MQLGNSGLAAALPQRDPQVMIGVDPNLSTVVSDRAILIIAKDLYLAQDAAKYPSPMERMRSACDDALQLLDVFGGAVDAWVAEKRSRS